ncbi:MAG TPA: hypothetical protein VFU45_03420 [Gemmatimonadales bacterium]|nr:hypothetical protein [Gemmatimonadales bacterium]
MNELITRLHDGLDALVGYGPAILAFLAIILAGLLFARQLERWIDGLLARINFNRMAEAGGISEAVGRVQKGLDPVHAVGKLVFWLVMLVAILLASAALGLESISQMFGMLLAFIPTLVTAIVIIILGIIVGEFVRGVITASAGSVEGVPTFAKLAKAVVVLMAVFMAISQMGVAAEIVDAAFVLIVGAVALAAGLAFGLGNRELAGEITRRWYEAGRRRRMPPANPASEGGAKDAPPPA